MDRFDLESKILELNSIVDDLNDISFNVIEHDMSEDDVVNAIDGLAVIVQCKINRLFDVFKQVYSLDEYNPNYSNCWDGFEAFRERYQEPKCCGKK